MQVGGGQQLPSPLSCSHHLPSLQAHNPDLEGFFFFFSPARRLKADGCVGGWGGSIKQVWVLTRPLDLPRSDVSLIALTFDTFFFPPISLGRNLDESLQVGANIYTCLQGVQTHGQIVKYLNIKYSEVKGCRECTFYTFWSVCIAV